MESVTRKLHEEVEAVHRSYRRELVLVPRNEVAIARKRKR